jgi:hypothetical protein
MSDLPRWRARSWRPVRFGHTSRTSWPRPTKKIAVCRPHPEAPSMPLRTTGPNCSAHASSARCPSPETRKCSLETIPPRGSTTVAVSVRLCGSTPTTFPARSGVINVLDGPGPRRTCLALLPIRVLLAVALRATGEGTGRQRPGRDRRSSRSRRQTLLSGQTGFPKTRTEADTSKSGHHKAGGPDHIRVRPRFGLRP